MIKELRKNEKSLGDKVYIQGRGSIELSWKLEYTDKHYQRVILYIGLCNDDQYRLLHHNNSNEKLLIAKNSRSKTKYKALKKAMKLIKEQNQIISQWI